MTKIIKVPPPSKPRVPRGAASAFQRGYAGTCVYLLDPPLPLAVVKDVLWHRATGGAIWLSMRTSFDCAGPPVGVLLAYGRHAKTVKAVEARLAKLGYVQVEGKGSLDFGVSWMRWQKEAA